MANQLNLEELSKQIEYSEKYYDDKYEYRHVILPKDLARFVIKSTNKRDLSEKEWRYFGIQMSKGWIHYGYHDPEPHILLFRRLFKGGPTPRVQMEMEISTNDSY